MFKLGEFAEKQWRRLRDFGYQAKVIEGIVSNDRIDEISVQ